MVSSHNDALTIGRLAHAAGVGVETIRYYQKRELVPIPKAVNAFRYYPARIVERIRFIKRAQELGFTLEEIKELLQLEDGIDRTSIRRIASDKLTQIEAKVFDLMRMQTALTHLVTQCQHTAANLPCPIIHALSQTND